MTPHRLLLAAVHEASEVDTDRDAKFNQLRQLAPKPDTIKVPDYKTRSQYHDVWRKFNDRNYGEVRDDDLYLLSTVAKFSRAGIIRNPQVELEYLRWLRGDSPDAPDCDERERVFYIQNLIDAGHATGIYSGNGSYYDDLKLGKITPEGVKYLQEKMDPKPAASTVNNQFNFHSPGNNVQVGNHNTQTLTLAFGDILRGIDASAGTPEQKAEAKSRLKLFIEHPLVTSVIGGVAGSLAGLWK